MDQATALGAMEEDQTFSEAAMMFPSPNWFLPRIVAVSPDGWVVYGAMGRGICVLIPHDTAADTTYRLCISHRAHADRVVCVDLSEGWPGSRCFVSGSTDGYVKQWAVEEGEGGTFHLRPISAHNAHKEEKEEVVGAGYAGSDYVVSVGSTGAIVLWNLAANVTRVFRRLMKGFKPVSVACSPHTPLRVAMGTKQGVLFVIDLKGKPQIVLKVRGHDDEITNLSWCPLDKVSVNKAVKLNLSTRLEKIRNEKSPQSEIDKKFSAISLKKEIESVDVKQEESEESKDNEESIVAEDDTFDIYSDHAADEFGHKKFQPEEVLVPVEKAVVPSDFLADCLKLKKEIIESKKKSEASIQSLVQSLENAAINGKSNDKENNENGLKVSEEAEAVNGGEATVSGIARDLLKDSPADANCQSQSYENLLATFDKTGKVCVWTNHGKLIGNSTMTMARGKQVGRPSPCIGLHWPRADMLLISDSKDNLLECNPMHVDSDSRLQWKVLHSAHKRGLYCVASGAPKAQAAGAESRDYPVWTVGQDRYMVQHSCRTREQLGVYATLGSFLYSIAPCPYDAQKLALGAGDGALRVFELSEDMRRPVGRAKCYWQNVQGKVLTVAWHPTREHQVAFGTAEGRVGLVDVSGAGERPARVLGGPLSRSVYSVCWGERSMLYACSVGRLTVINTASSKPVAEVVEVEFEGKRWSPTEAVWCERGLCVGGNDGEVGVLTPQPPHRVRAAAFHFQKQVHCISWHPQSVTLSQDEAPYKNWIATNAAENHIVVLELCEEEDTVQLKELATLRGHTSPVTRTAWSPHRAGQLLSTSQDATVRVWRITAAAEVSCTAVFQQHMFSSLAAAWSARPEHADLVLSGGGDCSLRLWDVRRHPPTEPEQKKSTNRPTCAMASPEAVPSSQEPKTGAAETNAKQRKSPDKSTDRGEEAALARTSTKAKSKISRAYLFPISNHQQSVHAAKACRKLLRTHAAGGGADGAAAEAAEVGGGEGATEGEAGEGLDFMKMFGGQDEFNELLDQEQERHLECGSVDKWMVLGMMRGEVERVFQFAAAHGALSPFLVSLAPTVSHKFWKDAVQMYVTQIDKETFEDKAKIKEGEKPKNMPVDQKLQDFHMGGYVLRKTLLLLSQHNLPAASAFLVERNMYREAYVLARVRHAHDAAAELLDAWTRHECTGGDRGVAAFLYMVRGRLMEASTVLSKSTDPELLGLAAEIASRSGQGTLARSLERKRDEQSRLGAGEGAGDAELAALPDRLALHLREELAGAAGEAARGAGDGEQGEARKLPIEDAQ